VLTAVAFAVCSYFGLVGDLPLWLLLSLLFISSFVGEVTGKGVTADATERALHGAIAAQVLTVSMIIYAIGWGPTLTIGYVFIIARALDGAGARVWRITLGWTVIAIALG
jgi:hypothetical protein